MKTLDALVEKETRNEIVLVIARAILKHPINHQLYDLWPEIIHLVYICDPDDLGGLRAATSIVFIMLKEGSHLR